MRPKSLLTYSSVTFLSMFCVGQLQAATISPNITSDPVLVGPGVGVDCSLRYAIESINTAAFEGGCATVSTGALGTNDTVLLGENDYLLSLSGDEDDNQTGDLDILSEVLISGAGSQLTSIDASGIAGGDRVMQITNSALDVSISGLTITGGDATALGNSSGGGLFAAADGTVVLDDVYIIQNDAGTGGGLFVDSGSELTMNNSTVDGNNGDGCGGGISILFSTVGISNSTVSNNESLDSDGGGICQVGDELFLTNSTISNNTAAFDGGGIFSASPSSTASFSGIKGSYNVTIAFNEAGDSGGGIASEFQVTPQGSNQFTTRVFNTIIAQNTAVTAGNDCANGNFLTGGFNLIGEIGPNDNCADFVNGVNGDQVGSPGSAINPLLGPLQFNGGTTNGATRALQVGSPAIDRGNPAGCQAVDVDNFINTNTVVFNDLSTDQRLLTRPVAILDPSVPICDIGAYEFQIAEPTPTPTPIPTPPVPPFNGLIEGSGCALGAGAAQGFPALAWFAGLGALAYRQLRRRSK